MCNIDLPSDSIKNLIDKIIEKYDFKNCNIRISNGSEKGDNYIGDIYRIKVVSNLNDSVLISMILKTNSPNDARKDFVPLNDYYSREAILYNVILPAFESFQKEYNIPIKDLFIYPKCYSASNEHLLMEDLSVKGFKMHDRFTSFDENHLILSLTSLARYHAISFAMKEKQPELYETFTNLVKKSVLSDFFHPVLEGVSIKTISCIKDEVKIEKLKNFSKDIVSKFYSYIDPEMAHPYNVICHGDCWNNNLLFRYEDGIPVEIMFLDWQISRNCSPVTDIAYMIYCGTDKPLRDKLGSKMFDIYHDALGLQLKKFGCDIDKCYPYKIFQDHIKRVLPFGLMMGMVVAPIILSEKGTELDVSEMVDYEAVGESKLQYSDNIVNRLHGIIDDFVDLGLI